ncbi:ABC transporter permease [Listeria costaricensis]|uniref:ABC transporter permease n=1 Tax=Listeria costaricensis TaxID=2026604 RepID=UPI000C07571B|nr:ABC-2 transporter permease [Listeria costaricensis]
MNKQLFSGTSRLVRLNFRRDRLKMLIWVLAFVATTLSVALAFDNMYHNDAERQSMAETMKNPAMVAMVGPAYGTDDYTTGPMMGQQMMLFTALIVGIMSIMLVAGQTRADEEDGALEMVRSLPTGRLANLMATLLTMLIVNVVLALVTGVGLGVLGISSMDWNGSLLYGACLGVAGLIFASITAIFAQICESSRGTIAFSLMVLGIFYLIRAIGDVTNDTLSYFSPLGWLSQTQVYVNDYWWPIGLGLALALIFSLLALYLNSIRDLGAGFLPTRPGRKTASRWLTTPLGLAFRLQRTTIIAWAIGMWVLGAAYGSVFGDLESFFNENEFIQQMMQASGNLSLTEQFVAMLMSILAIIASISVLMFILRVKGEENKSRMEHLLTRAVSRYRVVASYLIMAILFSFIMMFLAISGLYMASHAVMNDPISFMTFFKAGMVYLPAMLIMIGLALLLVGWLPKLTSIVWLYLVFSFFVVYLGKMLKIPDWMSNLTPYGWVPRLPTESFDAAPIVWMSVIGVVLLIIGMIGYRRRDVNG